MEIEGGCSMVIQSTMSPKAIIEVWEEALEVFQRYNVPIMEEPLQVLVDNHFLQLIVTELNRVVGSSSATCVEGG
jgi:hypothetical protein